MSEKSNPLKIVDISDINERSAAELLDAATSQGFLFVEGHGFSQDEVSALFEVSKQFFALGEEKKAEYKIDSSNHGYNNYGDENLDPSTQKTGDPKAALNFADLDFSVGLSRKPIPSFFRLDPDRLQLLQITIKKLYQLLNKILRILALALKIKDTDECPGIDWFTLRYDPTKASGSTFRLLHYPAQGSLNPEAQIRAGAHTDYGSVTLLFQQEGQEGLEIYSPVYKQWQAVPYVPANNSTNNKEAPPIIVNIADQLSYWTAGLLKSTIHRVKFPPLLQQKNQDRYSIVFFSHPNDDTVLEPVPSDLVQSNPTRGANLEQTLLTAKQHLQKRLASTYGWSY